MRKKGTFVQKYTLNGERKELVVEVELKKVNGILKPRQNLWYGVATANGKNIDHKDLPFCVQAQYMAEQIGEEIIAAWKIRAKKQGKNFRLKHDKRKKR